MLALWIILSIFTLVLDVITSSFFFAGFSIGGLFAMGMYFLDKSPMVQIIIFFIISILSILIIIPFGKKMRRKTDHKTVSIKGRLVDRELVLDKDVDDEMLMKVDGIYWTVKVVDGPLYRGDRVIVSDVVGNKLMIKRADKGE